MIPQLCDARCSWPDSLPSIFFDTYGPGSAEHKEIWCSRRLGTASPPQFCQTAVTNAQNEMELCTVLGDGCTAWYREASLAKARRECTRTRATPSSCGERALTEYNALITRCTAARSGGTTLLPNEPEQTPLSLWPVASISAAAASVFDTPHKPTFCDYAKRVVLPGAGSGGRKKRVGEWYACPNDKETLGCNNPLNIGVGNSNSHVCQIGWYIYCYYTNDAGMQACNRAERCESVFNSGANSGAMFSKISYNVTIPHGKTYKSTALVVESAVTEYICEDRNFSGRCVARDVCPIPRVQSVEDCQIECSMRLDCIAIVFNKYSNECFLKKEQGDAIETNDDLKAMPSIKNITEAFKQALDHSQENGQGDPTQVDCYGGSYANDLPGGKCPRDDHNEYSGDYVA